MAMAHGWAGQTDENAVPILTERRLVPDGS